VTGRRRSAFTAMGRATVRARGRAAVTAFAEDPT